MKEHRLDKDCDSLQDKLDSLTCGQIPVEGGVAEFDEVSADIREDKLVFDFTIHVRGVDGYVPCLHRALRKLGAEAEQRWVSQQVRR